MTPHEQKLSETLSRLDSMPEWEYEYFHDRSLMIPNRKEIILKQNSRIRYCFRN